MSSSLVLCPTHIRNGAHRYNTFIRPSEVSQTALELRSKALGEGTSPVAEAVAFVAQNIEYRQDRSKWGRSDFWQFPGETLALGTGDCEDMSFLLASLLISMGYKRVRTVYGQVRTRSGWMGHMWVEAEIDGRWYVLESTSGDIFLLSERGRYGYRAFIYISPQGCEYLEPSSTICPASNPTPRLGQLAAGIGIAILAGLFAALLFGRR